VFAVGGQVSASVARDSTDAQPSASEASVPVVKVSHTVLRPNSTAQARPDFVGDQE